MNDLWIEKWDHALLCKNSACRVKSCNRTKKLLNHSRQCLMARSLLWKKCGKCSKVIIAAKFHASHCRELLGCAEFPFCKRIKQNLVKKWKCDQCDREFQDGDNLNNHVTNKHKPVKKENEDLHNSNLQYMKLGVKSTSEPCSPIFSRKKAITGHSNSAVLKKQKAKTLPKIQIDSDSDDAGNSSGSECNFALPKGEARASQRPKRERKFSSLSEIERAKLKNIPTYERMEILAKRDKKVKLKASDRNALSRDNPFSTSPRGAKSVKQQRGSKSRGSTAEFKQEDLCQDPCYLPDMDCTIKKEAKTEIKSEPIEQHEYFENLMEVKKESFSDICLVKAGHPWKEICKEESIGDGKGNLDVSDYNTKQENSNVAAASESTMENVELSDDLKSESQADLDCLYRKTKIVFCDKAKAVASAEAEKNWMRKMKAEKLAKTALKKERRAERRRKAKLENLSVPENKRLDDVCKQPEEKLCQSKEKNPNSETNLEQYSSSSKAKYPMKHPAFHPVMPGTKYKNQSGGWSRGQAGPGYCHPGQFGLRLDLPWAGNYGMPPWMGPSGGRRMQRPPSMGPPWMGPPGMCPLRMMGRPGMMGGFTGMRPPMRYVICGGFECRNCRPLF